MPIKANDQQQLLLETILKRQKTFIPAKHLKGTSICALPDSQSTTTRNRNFNVLYLQTPTVVTNWDTVLKRY